ncbi:hypothetical protein [Stackebrandtia nassauensis]|uniref:ABC-2 type transporter n=1 Tax=Stackebrandtia nassauensis (strain DSM 44728 / CIP 108903 / NRRL B-16338 / NBRC 102104 / LLR-40K-21) TaxID=446470 RepID=D3Q4K8_STANL|nr:hypothetical protein [Stackebrandtia nassauensis]ADD40168.1 hypothetical protein Snas_0453 [Stackebrandtia nassauensis DSM 44728]
MSSPVNGLPNSGVIHNIGYRRYEGARLDSFNIAKALYSQTLRGSYGIGRGIVAKLFPWFLVGAILLPAFIIMAIMNFQKQPILEISDYTMFVQAVPALFLAVQAPHAVSRDLRFGVMPLYLSRPLTYRGYVHAKIAGVWTGLFALMAAPLLILYLANLLIKLPFGDSTLDLGASLFGCALLAALFTMLGLLIASVTPRRGLGVAAIIAVLMGSFGVASFAQTFLMEFGSTSSAHMAGMLSPVTLYQGVQAFLFDTKQTLVNIRPDLAIGGVLTLVTIAILVLSYLLLMARYRKVSSQ